jgi:signal transduction histidine kinase/DNA-binding response OmpR family regulator
LNSTPHFRFIIWPILWLTTFLLVNSCSEFESKKTYTIGFSQCVSNDAWRQAMQEEMNRELSFYPEFSLVIKDAQGSNENQIRQVREFINEGVDLLIISPNESDPLTQVVEEVYQSGLPVIVVDRKISSNLYSSYIGGDNYEIGYTAGQYIKNLTKEKGKILEIWGLKGSSPARERHRGLLDALEGSSTSIVTQIDGEWEKDTARTRIKSHLTQNNYPDFDLVFGHNDVMTIGAFEICRDLGLNGKKFIGVDALPGPYGGIQAITEGILNASFFYPTGGDKAIEIAHKILSGEVFEKEYLLQTSAVDSSNIRIMKQQTDKILDQQTTVFRQKEMINNQVKIYRNQRGLIMVFGITLFVAITSLAYVFKSLKDKQEINQELEEKNLEILDQQKDILKYAKKAEDATRHKLEFFTNISHEFRTPLTLIQGPVEELLERKDTFDFKNDILLIQKNTNRLLGLVNQVMDFRKIDNNKMEVKASLTPLVPFVEDVMAAFKKTADDLKVHFKLIAENPNLKVWFDPSMMDKVLFNLLSNSFKFIPEKGRIHIYIEEDRLHFEVIIRVEDNGPGMDKDEVNFIFDRFYQGKPGARKVGTGLGLALSKELVNLHKGAIKVYSTPGENTVFELRLKLGNSHLDSSELLLENNEPNYRHDVHEKFLGREPKMEETIPQKTVNGQKILIVEDDQEIRAYLKKKLEYHYEVLEADDPEIAWSITKEKVPDLITCDLMLKNKDGLNLVKKLKEATATSHIPIIIISAKATQEDRLMAIKLGIDDYFTKPFSLSLVAERIKALLEERVRLKEHYLHELPLEIKSNQFSPDNRKFTQQFKTLVEKNISNPDFGVLDICQSLGLSKGQLYRKMKTNLGYSVNDYINKVRLKKARFLLLNKDRSIGDIAFQVGFKTAAYFSTAFKQAYGIKPSTFRENAREV